MKNRWVTFEYNDRDEKIEIHANELGLKFLISQLEKLLIEKSDLHLMTPSWGGDELSEEKQCETNKLISHVKIFHWE
ncbi:Imm32 family immunity protein [Paenibacillus popilliae]|uniref:N-methylhydantoinase A/acetone carboxylase n=1 Tax=Paenibacillus popilliae ATCC 14706 TaxID=1212764 RepID=M9M070_PAEPP|nr:Imm32 family immunity protein [Paenibacillus popilliae]GAC42104.1 N-methylhydantoinase A/acetone carboxylase [Paenibacillus popilliae ATCC 14706]